MMLTVYIMMGLPASGKTTRAKEMLAANPNGIKRVSKDDLRAMLDGGDWSHDREKFILKARDNLILAALEDHKHVIVDDTNLHPRHLARIDQLIAGKAAVEIVDFTDVPVETCIERDLKRLNSVGSAVIWKMYWQFLHKPKEPITRNADLPDAIICDVDGTLALANNRGPYELEKAHTDHVNPSVECVVRWANDRIGGPRIIIMSGREDCYRELIERWLSDNGVRYAALFMRTTGDLRRDDIIKRELYEAHVKDKYNVLFVMDDRDRLVSMWRSEGLSCFQVNYGSF